MPILSELVFSPEHKDVYIHVDKEIQHILTNKIYYLVLAC